MSVCSKCIVVPHNGLGDHINTIGMCNYLSTIYDIVYHVCNPMAYENIKLFYNNDKVIIYKLNTDYNENFFIDNLFDEVENIYILGFHQNNPFIKNLTNKNIYGLENRFDPDTIPYSFYRQVNIDVNTFYDFTHMPNIEESNLLFELVKDIDYNFISYGSSNGDVFSIDNIILEQQIDIDNTLIINPVKNIYNENHKYYTLANHFIMKPIASYIKTIENASKIIVSNSCFMCLILNTKVKTEHVYYISPYDYSYLFDNKYNFTQLIHKYSFSLYKAVSYILKVKLLIKQYNFNYVVDYINKYKYHAIGMGDILNAFCYIKEKIMLSPFIFPIQFFQNTDYYLEPMNALEFRFKLIHELIQSNQLDNSDFLIVIPQDFIFDSLYTIPLTEWLIQSENTYIPICNIKVTSFKLDLKSINKDIIPIELLNEPYLVFNTKLRFINNYDYITLRKNLEIFFKNYKTKYIIVLLGEQHFGYTNEGCIHNIQTMYDELLQLKNNNNVIDLTTKTIINNLNYELYVKDISIMHYAKYSICCGVGGHFCSSLAFAQNTITYNDNVNFNTDNVIDMQLCKDFDDYLSILTSIAN